MKIETEVNVGDSVYTVYKKTLQRKVDCAFCGGRGKIIAFDANGCRHTIECHLCHGEGRVEREKYVVEENKVSSIRIDIDDCDEEYAEIWYRYGEWTFKLGHGYDTFKTRKEAQAYADELNKKEGYE